MIGNCAYLVRPPGTTVCRRLGPQPGDVHLCRAAPGTVGYLGTLERIAGTVAQTVAGVVLRGGAEWHSGAGRVLAASASVRAIAIRGWSVRIEVPQLSKCRKGAGAS
jgi:hypothetical protein